MLGKNFLVVIVIIISSILCAPYLKIAQAQTESITITTYYPSPYGVYRQLTVTDSMIVGTLGTPIDPTLQVGGNIRAPRFVDSDNTAYYIDPNGNSFFSGSINIGTTTANPAISINTPGDIYCRTLYQFSSKDYKRDIQSLAPSDYTAILEEISKIDIVYFRYKTDKEDRKSRIGLITEDAPDKITSEDKKSIDVNCAIGFLISAAKAQQAQIKTLEKEIERLKGRKLKKY